MIGKLCVSTRFTLKKVLFNLNRPKNRAFSYTNMASNKSVLLLSIINRRRFSVKYAAFINVFMVTGSMTVSVQHNKTGRRAYETF